MKKIFIFYFLCITLFIFGEVDTAIYKSYFQSNKYDDHIKGIKLINNNLKSIKENKEIIKLLLNEANCNENSNKLINASSDNYITIRAHAIKTIGLINGNETTGKIINILKNDKNVKIKEACIFALGQIGDDDNYNITITLSEYYKTLNLNSIKEESAFCIASIECFYKLSEYKTLEITEHLGLITLFKLFMKKDIFSDTIYNFSKKKLLNLMIRNS